MTAIRLSCAALDDLRLHEFSAALDIGKAQALGHLVCLWLWSARHKPDGEVVSISSRAVASLAEWGGDADRFYQALFDAGYVDDAEGLIDMRTRVLVWPIAANSTERVRRHRERKKAQCAPKVEA